jgi:hypothetical protein
MYAHPHGIYRRRGPQFVSDLVTEVYGGA